MSLWIWILFIASLVGLLAFDVGLTRNKGEKVTFGEAILSVFIWIMVAVGVATAIAIAYNEDHLNLDEAMSIVGDFQKPTSAANAALHFFTAYVVEISLSLDNVAVLSLLFVHFGVREEDRRKVLFWAIVGCLVARALLIGVFAQALNLHWMTYLFGALIAIAMLRTLLLPDESTDFDKRYLIRVIRALPWRTTPGTPMVPTESGIPRARLPIAAVALAAAAADISFATDSIPAVFSVTKDPLIAISSNLLALLALRSLFFAMQDAIARFRYLKVSVVLILLGLSAKTFYVAAYPKAGFSATATAITLGLVVTILATAIIASALRSKRLARIALEEAGETIQLEPRPLPIDDLLEASLATKRNMRKIGILIAGTVICIVGLLIAPLPGPGPIVVIPIGLAILATEFVWAKKLLDRFKSIQQQADKLSTATPLWLVPVVIIAYWAVIAALAHLATDLPWVVKNMGDIAPWKIYMPGAGLFVPIAYWAWKSIRANRSTATTNAQPPKTPTA